MSYQCYRGRFESDHPRPYVVSERLLIEWVKAEVERFQPPGSDIERDTANDAERARLQNAVADLHRSGAQLRLEVKGAAREAVEVALRDLHPQIDRADEALVCTVDSFGGSFGEPGHREKYMIAQGC